MIITTAKGSKFDTDKPAKSNICMILTGNGKQVLDTLRLTGKTTTVEEFMEKTSMIEVETSFGITEVNEEFLWQN
jgi:hypothetical protein